MGLLVVVSVVVAGARSAVASTPIGDPHGIALFATMHAAYARPSGVKLTVVSRGTTKATFGRYLLQLRAGVVVAEEFISLGAESTRVVARGSGPTYAWQARRTCWRRLPVADPRTLTDVGLPFPYGRAVAKAMPPQRTAGAWILSTENPDDFWFLATQTVYKPTAKRLVVYTIDARSGRVRALAIKALKDGNSDIRARRHPKTHWWTAQLKVTALSSSPRLANPKPAC